MIYAIFVPLNLILWILMDRRLTSHFQMAQLQDRQIRELDNALSEHLLQER